MVPSTHSVTRAPTLGATLGALILALALSAGCDTRLEPSQLKDDERILLDRLCRDPFIIVTDKRRNDDGFLIVTTHQGNTQVRYLFAPDGVASKELKIRRMVEDFEIKVGVSDQLGTGPRERGLAH